MSRPPETAQDDEELEELGDDVIISQQAAVHAPQPRAQVTDENRSIVISDKPPAAPPSSHPPPRSKSRSSRGENTVVIRDRRKLEEMRAQILATQKQHQRQRGRVRGRGVYLWAGAALAAFLLGGVAALLAGSSDENQLPALPSATVPTAAAAQGLPSAEPEKPATVDLEDLPVERRTRRKR